MENIYTKKEPTLTKVNSNMTTAMTKSSLWHKVHNFSRILYNQIIKAKSNNPISSKKKKKTQQFVMHKDRCFLGFKQKKKLKLNLYE